jgi:hypothetical protein
MFTLLPIMFVVLAFLNSPLEKRSSTGLIGTACSRDNIAAL